MFKVQISGTDLYTPKEKISNEELVQSGFDVLGTFMQIDKPIIDDSIEIIVQMCVNVLQSKDIDRSILNSAAQTLVTAFECRPKLIQGIHHCLIVKP